MPLTVAVAQYPTQKTLTKTLTLLHTLASRARESNVHLLLLPEAFLGGYPRSSTFGASIGSRTDSGRDEYYAYWSSAVDLGDVSPEGLGIYDASGDGTRERLEAIAQETGVFLAVGLVEKSGGSLWCGVIYVDPVRGVIGKRRKVMPTGTERVVWSMGSQKTLKAVTTHLGTPPQPVTLAAAICWENYMPLLRSTIYAQGVNIYLAPTADARESWVATMQHIALEGRCYVLGCNQFVTTETLPGFVPAARAGVGNMAVDDDVLDDDGEGGGVGGEVVCNGGSVIFDPLGQCVAGPLWGGVGVLKVEIGDVVRETVRAKMDFDGSVGGHYSRSDRSDVFKLSVEGLELGSR